MRTKFHFELLWLLIYVYMLVAYIANLIKLIDCDWASPFKEEVVHLIGAFIFPASMITCWY